MCFSVGFYLVFLRNDLSDFFCFKVIKGSAFLSNFSVKENKKNLGSMAKNLIFTIKLIFMGNGMVWSQFFVQLWHAESESWVLTVARKPTVRGASWIPPPVTLWNIDACTNLVKNIWNLILPFYGPILFLSNKFHAN